MLSNLEKTVYNFFKNYCSKALEISADLPGKLIHQAIAIVIILVGVVFSLIIDNSSLTIDSSSKPTREQAFYELMRFHRGEITLENLSEEARNLLIKEYQ